jgi:hypothetical protein
MNENSGSEKSAAERVQAPGSKRTTVWAVVGVVLLVVAVGGIWLAHKRGVSSALWGKLPALPQSAAWDWVVALGFVSLTVLGVVVLWKGPQWQVARVEGLDAKEQFNCRNEARKTLATILGGAVLLTGGFFTWRNVNLAQESLRVNQESQITDRFTKAIEQLGAVDASGKPKLEARLGGIYSLEAIGNESEGFHWPIVEVLCTYVRVNAPATSEKSPASAAQKDSPDGLPSDQDQHHPRADIQAILDVLGRRDSHHEKDNQWLNLSSTYLGGADLHRAYLGAAIFQWAHLEKANLFYADLKGAHLNEAQLQRAELIGAQLKDADLGAADLSDANLSGANLSGADLTSANLRGVDIGGVLFIRGDPTRKGLVGADLSGADLSYAKLSDTDLSEAKNLTQKQVDSADGNLFTKLPTGLCLPRNWIGVQADTPGACSGP